MGYDEAKYRLLFLKGKVVATTRLEGCGFVLFLNIISQDTKSSMVISRAYSCRMLFFATNY